MWEEFWEGDGGRRPKIFLSKFWELGQGRGEEGDEQQDLVRETSTNLLCEFICVFQCSALPFFTSSKLFCDYYV